MIDPDSFADVFDLLRQVLRTQGVKTRVLSESMQNLAEYDGGLREYLFEGYDYSRDAAQIARICCVPWDIVDVQDIYGVLYTMFRTKTYENEGFYYLIIGPYFNSAKLPDAAKTAEKLGLCTSQANVLAQYYETLPIIKDVSGIVNALYSSTMPDIEYRIRRAEMYASEDLGTLKKMPASGENSFQFRRIQDRYKLEAQVQKAIERGRLSDARAAMYAFSEAHADRDFSDDINDRRLYLTSLNVLLQKAAMNAQVHPAHIDRVSSYYKQQILEAEKKFQFSSMADCMLRDYCDLVNTYSLSGYSQLIRDVMEYIEFHLQEDLDLKTLAGRFSVNASYLSGRFKKECGKTLTDHVNDRRMERAMQLLDTTALPVSDIAAAVGITDRNYFSRRFRRYTGLSPSRYRGRTGEGQ